MDKVSQLYVSYKDREVGMLASNEVHECVTSRLSEYI